MDTSGSATPSAQEIALLRKLARLTRIGAWEIDVATERLYWTDEVYRLHEVDPTTPAPTIEGSLAFFAPEGRPLAAQTVRNGIERGIAWDLELPLLTARGRRIWVRTRGEPEMVDGRCLRVAGTLEDITAARVAREALRARTTESRKLALVAENTSDLVLITDAAHRIEWVNTSFEQVTGYTSAEAIGRTARSLLGGPVAEPATLTESVQRAAPVAGVPLELHRKDGSTYWVELEQRPVRDETGAITHFIEIQHDVTARRAGRQREQDLVQRLRLITSSTRIGIFERDLDTGVGVWDHEAFRLLGFPPGPGAPPLEALLQRVHPDDRAEYRAYLDDARHGSIARDVEYRVVHDDGRIGYLHERGSAERAPGGRRFVIGVVLDVTEQRVAERHALAAAEQLALAVGATGVGFYHVAGDGTTWVCDAQASALLGFEAKESRLGQRTIESMIMLEDRPQAERLRAERVLAAGATEVSFRIVRRDGARRWMRARCAAAPLAAGDGARLFGIVVDVTEQKERELQQALQQERLGLAVGAAGIGTWDIDLLTGARVWSEQLRSIFAVASDAPMPTPEAMLEIVVAEDRPRVREVLNAIPQAGQFAELEYRIRRFDGEVRHVLTRRAAQYDPGGRAVRVFGVTIDVTEARRAAEALRKALARLELATAGAGVGIFSRDLIANQAHWDAQTFRLFGLDPSTQPPDWPQLLATLHPDERERYGRILAAAAETGEFPDTELRVVDRDGALRHVLVRGRTERLADGTVAGLGGVVLDITARKEAENRAAEFAEWLRLATESIGIGFAQRDLITGVGKWSDQAKRMLGLPPEAPTPSQQEFLARIAPEDRPRADQVLRDLPRAGRTAEVELRLHGHDDAWRRLLVRVAARHDETGRAVHMFAAAIDVTESRAAEDRLHAALRRLELATTGSAIGIFERELDKQNAYWSREAFALWGVPEPAAPNWRDLVSLVHPDDRAMFESQWHHLARSTEFVDSEFRVVRPDGTEGWLLTRGRFDPGDSTRSPRVIGVVLDITLRKRAERRASEMAGWLGLATRTVGIGLWYRDPQQDRPIWDAQMFRVFGLNAGAGTPSDEEWLAMILEEDRAPLEAVHKQPPPPRTTLAFEYRIRRPDGEIRHLQSRRACLYDTAGRPQRVFGAVLDITETRTASAALSAAQARLSLAAEVGGIASWERNLETGEARWDPLLFRFYGLEPTRPALSFAEVTEFVHPDDRARFTQDWQRMVALPGTVEWEARVVRPDASVAHLITRARAERRPDGRPVRVVGATLDVTSLRRTAQRLQEALERLRLAGEASGIGTWERDLNTDVAVWDTTMYRLYGLGEEARAPSRAQAVALVHADDRERVVRAWQEIQESDQSVEFGFRVVQPDGSIRHLTARGRVERHPDGRPWRVLGATIDVTEARRTSEELRAALAHLRLVGETARIGTWERDLVTYEARWDAVMFRLYGLEPGDTPPTRRRILEMVHPDDRERLGADWAHMLDVDHTVEVEYRVIRPDGSLVHLQSRRRVERDADGRPRRALGATIDITANRLAERQLRELDDWLRLAGSTTGIGFFLHPSDGSAHFNDAQMRRIFGFVGESGDRGENEYLERVVPEDRHLVAQARERALHTDAPVETEYRIRLPDGSVRVVLTRRSMQRDQNGRPLHVAGIALDVTESRLAARALRAANERLQLATTTAGIGIWERDLVSGQMQWDERQRAIYGVDAAWRPDFERWLELVHPADRDRLRQTFVAPARGGSIEYRAVRRDGEVRTLVGNFTRETDANGASLRLLGTNLDVTEVRAAQRERDALVERMQVISETVGVGVWDWDPDSNTSVWNDRMYELFGHTHDSFASRTWLDMLHPDDVPGAESAMQAALGERASFDIEFRVVWPDGSVHWIASRGRAERDALGRTVRVLGVNMDITERRRSERAARDLLERMQLTTKATGIGLWEYNLTERALHWDEQLYRLVGRAPDDLPDLLRDWTSVLHPDDVEQLAREQRRSLRDRRALDIEVRVVLPDGSLRYLTLRGQLRFDADGHPITQFGVAFDVTEHKLTETALRAKEMAERASQAKTEFLSRMSHELRTPLHAILGFTQILEIDQAYPLAPLQRDHVQHIKQAGWHLVELIDEILDLSRIEAGKARLSMARVPLGEVIDDCLALVGTDAAKRGIETAVMRQADAPESVWADPLRVKQVLLNLLSNAIKYNRDHGSVRVTVGADAEGNALIAVRDTGLGLSAKQIDQLFQPFNRLGLESAPIQGTGIGLALSLRLTEQMGGRLEVSSEPGVGTEFRVTLPVATAQIARVQEGAAPLSSLDQDVGGRREDVRGSLLYVEDNPKNVEVVEQMLALRPQVRLFTAPDGATARVLAAACQPDLILLDMRLPDTDGLTLFRELRAQPETREIPCAGVSADALPSNAALARNAGFVEYWTKPLDARLFLGGIDALLGARRS
ncbi:MAG TPA: PAS domain-containing protein [Burkholderiaceae bacterium]|nr:PAS domain-containing protein [Burkholderiaceae bacterium]